MKKSHLLGAVCAFAVTFCFSVPAKAAFEFSNLPGGEINFDPTDGCIGGAVGCFDFTPAGGAAFLNHSLQITSGTASGIEGRIDGLFAAQSITSSVLLETADIKGIGTFSLWSANYTFSASVVWEDIFTYGTAGGLNTTATANLSNISYLKTAPDPWPDNADLKALEDAGAGIMTLSFQFDSPTTLTQLLETNTSITSTSFSGSIAAVPIPAAVWLFGSGLMGLVGIARRKKA